MLTRFFFINTVLYIYKKNIYKNGFTLVIMETCHHSVKIFHSCTAFFYLIPSSGSWKRVEAPQSGPSNPPTKRRRRSSPGPVIVIKDEPEDDEVHFVRFFSFCTSLEMEQIWTSDLFWFDILTTKKTKKFPVFVPCF